jgi:hypothetical protein
MHHRGRRRTARQPRRKTPAARASKPARPHLRTSRSILVVAVTLAVLSVCTGLHGLGSLASLAHGTDVYRDDVGAPLERMYDALALDHDRAAAVLGMAPYLDGSADTRDDFERDVRSRSSFFLADAVVRRVAHERFEVGARAALISATCLAAACALAFLSRGVARLERTEPAA